MLKNHTCLHVENEDKIYFQSDMPYRKYKRKINRSFFLLWRLKHRLQLAKFCICVYKWYTDVILLHLIFSHLYFATFITNSTCIIFFLFWKREYKKAAKIDSYVRLYFSGKNLCQFYSSHEYENEMFVFSTKAGANKFNSTTLTCNIVDFCMVFGEKSKHSIFTEAVKGALIYHHL